MTATPFRSTCDPLFNPTEHIANVLKSPGMYVQNPASLEDQLHVLNCVRGTVKQHTEAIKHMITKLKVSHSCALSSTLTTFEEMGTAFQAIEDEVLGKSTILEEEGRKTSIQFRLYVKTKAMQRWHASCMLSLQEIITGYGATEVGAVVCKRAHSKTESIYQTDLRANEAVRAKLCRVFPAIQFVSQETGKASPP